MLHELGHCFQLGHTDTGIMERGFDHLDSLLTVGEEGLASKSGVLSLCGGEHASTRPNSGNSQRFTNVKRSESVSKFLEGVQAKKREGSGSSCKWGRSCALLLARQPWLGGACSPCGGEVARRGEEVVACCWLAVAELRGERGAVRTCWEGGEEVAGLELEGVREAVGRVRGEREGERLELVLAMHCGRVARIKP